MNEQEKNVIPKEEVVMTASAEEVAPAEEAAPVEETAPIEEATPAEEVAPTEEATLTEEAAPAEEAAPEKPAEKAPKKNGKAGKIILAILGVILAIILLLCVAGCVAIGSATKDDLPEAPDVSGSDLSTFAVTAAEEILLKNTITLSPEDINLLLAQIKSSVNGSTDIIQIEDLFCSLEDSSGTIYARVKVTEVEVKGITIPINKTIPLKAGFDVKFQSPDIVVTLGEVYCGKIKIPQTVIDAALANVALPKDMRIENGLFYYDTTSLDTMIDTAATDAINNSIGNDTLAGLISGLVSKVVNVTLEDAKIEGGELIINGSVF